MAEKAPLFNLATRDNLLLHLLSRASVPLANFFLWAGIKPFTITTFSNLTGVLALISLYAGWPPALFGALWVFALMLDISDGMVARVTGQASANGSFYDHFSDKIKVVAVFLTASVIYDEMAVWIACWVACTSFLLMSVANEGLGSRSLRLSTGARQPLAPTDPSPSEGQRRASTKQAIKSFLRTPFAGSPRVQAVFNSAVIIQGNSMVWLVLLAYGSTAAVAVAAWFALCCLRALLFIVRAQITVNKALTAAKISWK